MESPWGALEVRDAHVHFFSHPFFASLAHQSRQPVSSIGERLGWELPPEDPEGLADRWDGELERYGIRSAALIASMPGDESSVAAAVARRPDRFHGYFMLDPTAPDAAERLERALSGGVLCGVCLFPAMHRYSVHCDSARRIFDAASRYPGTVVFVHCGVLTVGVRKKLGLPSRFDMRFSNPIDLHAIALEFPKANFVVPHFGAGYFREALMLCDLCPNVYLDTSSSNGWVRYQPGNMDLAAVFRSALEVTGSRRLLFGSDSSFFPRGWNAAIFREQAAVLHGLGTDPEQAALIFGGNLQRLLSL